IPTVYTDWYYGTIINYGSKLPLQRLFLIEFNVDYSIFKVFFIDSYIPKDRHYEGTINKLIAEIKKQRIFSSYNQNQP
ncbi:MAG: hypothetical protein LPJ98_07270, partial [Cyclobacteriaceae bacterium]|nr:hypothetical protein [Cyclobacteriaceae bacterium]